MSDDPENNGLRHFPRRDFTGDMQVVDRVFDFVRAVLPYNYAYTSNSQQWREAELICRALEGPMESAGILRVKDGKVVSNEQVRPEGPAKATRP